MTALLLLLACAEDDVAPLHFDGPVAAAVLETEDGPFEEVAGFVASSRNGTIYPLDLKEGRLLTDDSMASWLRASAIATGRDRLLSDLSVFGGGDTVDLWTIDQGRRQLLRAPYVTDFAGGEPVEVVPEAGEATFVDADGSGDAVTFGEITTRAGYTTTEEWSFEYDGARWWAKGSRSGVQVRQPFPGATYVSDAGEIELTFEGAATAGDYATFHTETGIVEWQLDGGLTGLLIAGERVYVSVATDPGQVLVYDAVESTYVGAVTFPAGAQPGRLAAAPDGRIFVADGAQAVAWVFRFDQDSHTSTVPIEPIAVAAPLVDLAWQGGNDATGVPFEHLFVAPVAALRVDVYDLVAGAWIDPNPTTPEVEGVLLGSPVVGLAASVGAVELQREDAWGARPRVPTVSVSTADGYVWQLEGPTGCGVTDERGPYTPNAYYDANADLVTLQDQGALSDPFLWTDEATGSQVVPSSCGGVARTETWTVTYDSATLSWEVEGSLSGVQVNRAFEDLRYVSDDGAISFLIAAGSLPATDGDRFEFPMNAGLLVFGGSDTDEDGTVNVAWEFPGRPAGFQYTAGPTGGGWDPVDRREFMLLPVVDGDIVARLHLDSGETETYWE